MKSQRISIATSNLIFRDCLELREVDAYVDGEWAAHPLEGWRVTHVLSGRACATGLCEAEAVEIARALARRVPHFDTPILPPPSWQVPATDEAWIILATIAEVLGEGSAL